MDISSIEHAFSDGKFIKNNTSVYTFGRSNSTFWILIISKKENILKDYVSIYNPNVESLALYIPTQDGYIIKKSGWKRGQLSNEILFPYPVFKWDKNTERCSPIFIQVQSPYTHNYTVNFYTNKELIKLKEAEIFISALLIGGIFTLVILNFFIYLESKNIAYLILVQSMIIFTIYHFCISGLFNSILLAKSYMIMDKMIAISSLFMVSQLFFFIKFCDLKKYRKKYYYIILSLITINIIIIGLSFIDKVTANTLAFISAMLGSSIVFYFSIRMFLYGHIELKLFVLSWGFMILVSIVSLLRTIGLLPNNVLTINIAIITMLAQSILNTVAIAEKNNILLKKKHYYSGKGPDTRNGFFACTN